VIGWDRANDEFTLGQWLHARIYERRCDLSPDGRYFIYFAMNGRWESRVKGAWTAISQAPYLKALCLWAKGDCWHGGGLFVGRRQYWLNYGHGHEQLEDDSDLTRSASFPWTESYGGECPGVYYIRLQRDDWRLGSIAQDGSGGQITVFDKRVTPQWTLRKLAHATIDHPVGRGCYYDEHELHNNGSGRTLAFPEWEWADVDRSRLAWAEGGRLYVGALDDSGLKDVRCLHDFNDMRFEPIPAPY